MPRRFHTLDVFTATPLAGNPLAVVHDSEGLDTARMQAIAAEFNLSETVFVLPPDDPANTARIRIFTPESELPFAGHPTVGAAVLLATLRAPELLGVSGVVVALEEAIGLVPCEVRRIAGRATRAVFPLPRLPQPVALPGTEGAILASVGLVGDDRAPPPFAISGYTAGLPYVMVPVADRAALARARPRPGPDFDALYKGPDRSAPYLFCPGDTPHRWHTRMFAPHLGVREDPATGSAVASFAGAVMAMTRPSDGEHQHIIRQGEDMGRPSEIVLTLTVEGGVLTGATIGGEAVIVSEGTIDL